MLKRAFRWCPLGAIAIFLLSPFEWSMAQSRPFDVRASVEFTTFASGAESATRDGIYWSANGDDAAFVTSHGVLSSNTVESTLWLVQKRDLLEYLHGSRRLKKPPLRAIAILRATPVDHVSTSRAPIISSVRWTTDSSSLFFLAEVGQGAHRLYRADIETGHVTPVSPLSADVLQYDLSGQSLVYASTSRQVVADEAIRTPQVIRDESLVDILFPGDDVSFTTGLHVPDLHMIQDVRYRSTTLVPKALSIVPDKPHANRVFSLSPDSRYLVRLLPVHTAVPTWSRYVPIPGYPSWTIDPQEPRTTSPSNRWRLRQYVLTDLRTGQTIPILNVPSGEALGDSDRIGAIWSHDGHRLLISNTTFPIPQQESHPSSRGVCAVASVEFPSRRTTCMVPSRDASSAAVATLPFTRHRLEAMAFDETTDKVTLRFGTPSGTVTEHYRFDGGAWESMTMPHTEANPHPRELQLEVRQGINLLPQLWGVDTQRHVEKLIFDPNPEWSPQSFGTASLLHWNDSSGYGWTGILVRPISSKCETLCPLVIQTHGADPNRFLLDGKYSTAEAAQALAAAGFAVLQMPYRSDHVGTPLEASDQLAGYRAAIDTLSARGLVDPGKVGIVGFSRTGFHVEEALIHAPTLFAAAVIADGTDMSYMPYRLFSRGDTFVATDLGHLIGGAPTTSQGVELWESRASGFHLNQVHTPLLVQAIGPVSMLLEWELYSTVKELQLPSELLYLSTGQHILQAPRDMEASQQATVDWFRRWLQ